MELINKTISEILEETANKYPNQEALVFNKTNTVYSYSELNKKTDEIAKSFLKLGIKKGEHVAIWSTNLPEWIICQLATAKIGAIFVPINTNYKDRDLEYVLENSDAKVLIICDGFKDNNYIDTLNSLSPTLKYKDKMHLDISEFPMLKNIIYIGKGYPDGMLSWEEFAIIGKDILDEELIERKNSLSCHDVINMQYTSGTTGFPKGVMLTHYNIINNGFSLGEGMKYTYKDRLCLSVPLFHCFGCVVGVMACITHGTTMVLIEYYNTREVLETIDREKCTSAYGVPTMFILMMEHKDFDKYDLSSLRTGVIGGSTCPEQIVKNIINKMGIYQLTVCYGQTESSPISTQTSVYDSLDIVSKTVGRELPFVEVKILNPLNNEEMPVGVEGEICVRGYHIMKGYYKKEEETKKTIDEDGWLHSGDLGIKNPDGTYRVSGRIKDIIIRGGENISAKEVEEVLFTNNSVENVQVVGIPDKYLGEEMMCFIVAKKGCILTEQEIKSFIGEHLAKYKVPKYVQFIDEFPTTANGKIQKFKLIEIGKNILGLE